MWGLYVFFALVMLAALLALVAAVTDCPWLASFATGLLLVLMVVYGILVLVGVALLKVGSDGCAEGSTPYPTLCAPPNDLLDRSAATIYSVSYRCSKIKSAQIQLVFAKYCWISCL